MKQLISIIIFFLLTTDLVAAQNIDSTQTDTTQTSVDDAYEATDDFAPGLAFLALITVGLILVYVGAGIALTVIGLLIIFGLIALGILSASVLVGLNKKSFVLGFKTFLVSTSTIGGLILFGIGFWVLNKILHWWTTQTAITIGVAFGLLTGLLFGFIGFYIIQRLTTYLRSRLNLAEG